MANSATALHACCLSGPAAHQIPGGIPTKGASAGQIFCRIVTIFYQKTECYGNSCQYDIHQCALLHVEPPFFMAFFPKSKLSSSCLPDAVTHPLSGLLQAYLCAQRTLMSIQKPQCQRPFQPSIQIMIQYSSVIGKIFHYSHETRWIPRLPLCRWSPVRYIHGSLF